MAEYVIRVNVNLGGWSGRVRWGRWLMAAAMFLAAVPELASESVTLTTYYPAPSGVYTQMITTGNTYLARDTTTGAPTQVTIGSSANGTGQQLDVYSSMNQANNGAIRASAPAVGLGVAEFAALAHRSGFWSSLYANQGSASYAAYINGATLINNGGISGNYGLTPSYQNWSQFGTGSGGAAIYNSNEISYQALMIVGNSSAGGVRRVSVWDELNVNGNHNIYGVQYIANGSFTMASYVSYASGACYFANFFAGPSVPICAGGYYATLQGGFMSKYVLINNGVDPNGEALCCPCPAGLKDPFGYAASCPSI